MVAICTLPLILLIQLLIRIRIITIIRLFFTSTLNGWSGQMAVCFLNQTYTFIQGEKRWKKNQTRPSKKHEMDLQYLVQHIRYSHHATSVNKTTHIAMRDHLHMNNMTNIWYLGKHSGRDEMRCKLHRLGLYLRCDVACLCPSTDWSNTVYLIHMALVSNTAELDQVGDGRGTGTGNTQGYGAKGHREKPRSSLGVSRRRARRHLWHEHG